MIEWFQHNWVVLTIVSSIMLFILPWLWVFKISQNKKRILATGIRKPARLVRYKPSMFKSGKQAGSEFMQGVDLWVEIIDGLGNKYEVKTRTVIHISEFSKLYAGMPITVRVDPRDQNKVVFEKVSHDNFNKINGC